MQRTGTRKSFMTLMLGVAIGGITFGAIAVQAADKYEARPFSGATTGTTESQQGANGAEATSTGTLNATHVGNATYELVTTQDYPRHTEEQHPTGQCAFVEDGEDGDGSPGFTITAANGDQLFAYLDDDRSVVCAPDDQPPVPRLGDEYHSTLYMTVIGGTGRFEDANGWLFSEGISELTAFTPLPPFPAETVDEGTILGDIDY